MKAMILAAGLGTRLGALTESTPKALIEAGGAPLIDAVIGRLSRAGARDIVVNAFHLADRLERHLASFRTPPGVTVRLLREARLLDTGGGILNASRFLGGAKPFFVHNVDVFSDIDLSALYRFHLERGALATLAVQDRPSARALLFDQEGLLRGRAPAASVLPPGQQGLSASAPDRGAEKEARSLRRLAFNGIHVMSPEIFSKMTERGAFSITDAYLRLAAQGERLLAFDCGANYWRDAGSPEGLQDIRGYAARRGLPD